MTHIKTSKVFAVGVGPGFYDYITKNVQNIILDADIIIGYEFTLNTIRRLLKNKNVYTITMENQEEIYNKIKNEIGNKKLVVPFTGDVNFSESEVVDRLIQIFGNITIIPGISSIQVAASKAQIALDKTKVITFHVSTPIENKKIELLKGLIDGFNIIALPRPWAIQPKKQFMHSEFAFYLKNNGFDTSKMHVIVYESLTMDHEKIFNGKVSDLENKKFSDLSIIIIKQSKLESYYDISKVNIRQRH